MKAKCDYDFSSTPAFAAAVKEGASDIASILPYLSGKPVHVSAPTDRSGEPEAAMRSGPRAAI
jgi:hypothetical protein